MKFAAAQLDLWPDAKTKETSAAGEPRLIIRLCAHMLESGRLCRQPAVRGRRHCRGHIRLRVRRPKMARARRRLERLRLPPLLDVQGVETGLARVRVALDGGHIDRKLAGTLRWSLHLVAFCRRERDWEQAAREADGAGRDDVAVAAKSNGDYGVPAIPVNSRGYNIDSS